MKQCQQTKPHKTSLLACKNKGQGSSASVLLGGGTSTLAGAAENASVAH